jgi:adenine-specific DNA-methyltransferase
MEKLKQESVNLTEQNIDRIASLFPSAMTETRDADGNLKKAINFDTLKQLLSEDVVEGDECYEFTWVGKKQSIIDGNRPIRKTLRPCPDESKNWDKTENLYIEGDNLEVLKLLQGSYLGGIKMIYIDPPYNTGNDFVYRDNFTAKKDDYEDDLGLYDEEENRLFKNNESNGRFHSDWCSMIYPRLQLASNLLSDDGVIFISIDDNEVSQLRKICDEVFGEVNFVAQICHKSRASVSNDKIISSNHNHILFYAKQQEVIFQNRKNFGLKPLLDGFDKEDERGKFKLVPVDGPGGAKKGNPYYEFMGITGYWRFSKERMSKMYDEGLIVVTANNLQQKYYLEDAKNTRRTTTTWWDEGLYTSTATGKLSKLMDSGAFDTPKPVELIIKMLELSTFKNSIILDFFSGSSTTAHAIMQLNAEDNGARKFIMVQLPEQTDEKSEAFKAGYKNICEIGKERIRRASKKIEEELQSKSKGGELFKEETKTIDTGFRVLKLDSTNMKDVYYGAGEYSQQMLLDLESNIKDDRTDLDLLYGVLLDWGVPLSLPHTTETIEGKRVHFVNDTDLVACFEESINENIVREIAKRKPLRVVFRDSSFANSPDKINVTEIFKTLSSETTVKVI